MAEKRITYRLFVGKPEGKRPLGRQKCRWVGNIKIDLVEIGCGGVDWMGLAQDRYKLRALVNGNEPSGSIKHLETIEWLHIWWVLEYF
jgi:hypothetical protein